MLFEVYQNTTGNKYEKGKWFVRHILSQTCVMALAGGLETEAQAKVYAAEFENSPFIWCFTNPQDLKLLNDIDTLLDFVTATRKKAKEAK